MRKPWRDPLVGLPSTGATLRPTQTASGPQPVAQRSEIISEEPGARDVQARICGGPGWATTQVYPALSTPSPSVRRNSADTILNFSELGMVSPELHRQVVPRLILPARTGADQPFGADLVLCSEWRTPPFTYHFHSNSSWMSTLVKLR